MSTSAISVIHKFIRRELFDFAQQLFRAEPHDVHAIRTALENLGELLRGHATQEELRFEAPLRAADPALAEQLSRDHRRLEDFFEGLLQRARELDSKQPECRRALFELHLDWNRFVSAYLMHLDDEERTLFTHIADSLPPLAALVHSARSQGQKGEEFLLRLWAVTTCEERIALENAQDSMR